MPARMWDGPSRPVLVGLERPACGCDASPRAAQSPLDTRPFSLRRLQGWTQLCGLYRFCLRNQNPWLQRMFSADG